MSSLKMTVNCQTSNTQNVEITRVRNCVLVSCGTHSLARLIEEKLTETLEAMEQHNTEDAEGPHKIGFRNES